MPHGAITSAASRVHFSRQLARGDRLAQQRQERKLFRRAPGKQLRAVDADARVGESLTVTFGDLPLFEREVAARMLRRVLHQHQMRMRTGGWIATQRREVDIRPHIAVHEQERCGS
jgi:hypothetical protein